MRGCRLQFTRLSALFSVFLSANCQRTLSSCCADAVQALRLLALFDWCQNPVMQDRVGSSPPPAFPLQPCLRGKSGVIATNLILHRRARKGKDAHFIRHLVVNSL